MEALESRGYVVIGEWKLQGWVWTCWRFIIAVSYKLVDLEKLSALPDAVAPSHLEPSFRLSLATFAVLSHYLGDDWITKWVLRDVRGQRGFVRWASAEEAAFTTSAMRTLAEGLVNFQRVGGFWSVVETLHDKGPEIGHSEFSSAFLLARLNIPFRFHVPTGIKGDSFDLDIRLDGLDVCGETKCKLDGSAPSPDGLLRSVEKARANNLPKDRPGVIFAHVPRSWIGGPKDLAELAEAVATRLSSSGRLVGVFVHFYGVLLAGGHAGSFMMHKFIKNPNSRFPDIRLSAFERKAQEPGNWIDLVRLWGPSIFGSTFTPYDPNASEHG